MKEIKCKFGSNDCNLHRNINGKIICGKVVGEKTPCKKELEAEIKQSTDMRIEFTNCKDRVQSEIENYDERIKELESEINTITYEKNKDIIKRTQFNDRIQEMDELIAEDNELLKNNDYIGS